MFELIGMFWILVFIDFFNNEMCSVEYCVCLNQMGEVLVYVDGDLILM